MKSRALLFILLVSFPFQMQAQSFVEENRLHEQPSLEAGVIDEASFNEVLRIAQLSYDSYIQENGLKPLRIGGFWTDNTVNAYTSPQLQRNIITVYGGIARRPELTLDGFALIVCHEIGHAYGGAPDKLSPIFKVSVEGQADYYGAGVCLRRIIDQIPAAPGTPWDKTERLLQAGLSVGRLLSFIKGEAVPTYETPDSTVVSQTLGSYPARIQCRLDTYRHGILNLERPRCWYRS